MHFICNSQVQPSKAAISTSLKPYSFNKVKDPETASVTTHAQKELTAVRNQEDLQIKFSKLKKAKTSIDSLALNYKTAESNLFYFNNDNFRYLSFLDSIQSKIDAVSR